MQHLSSKQTSPSTKADLWRIAGCLTPEQTRRFSRETKLLASAMFLGAVACPAPHSRRGGRTGEALPMVPGSSRCDM